MQSSGKPTDKLISVGKYEVRRVLGRGAMGTVYEGWDPNISRRVAIKTVRLPDAADEEAQEELARFRREAQAAGRLHHPNLVGVYDYGETPDFAYIVMEFVDGKPLKAVMDAEERLPLPAVRQVMDDLLTGLEYSHERGVIHRDIKPANLILTAGGRAKIADFGIARIESSSMTQAGTVLGTPAYMSPEQFMGQVVDLRTDIYSSGVLLYQLLTGEKPFEGSLTAIMHKVLNSVPPRPSELSVTAPPALDGVVATAMARRPEDRYASASAFGHAIRTALDAPQAGLAVGLPAGLPASSDATVVVGPRSLVPGMAQASKSSTSGVQTSQSHTIPATPRERRKVPVVPMAMGAAALLGIAGAAGWWTTRGTQAPVASAGEATGGRAEAGPSGQVRPDPAASSTSGRSGGSAAASNEPPTGTLPGTSAGNASVSRPITEVQPSPRPDEAGLTSRAPESGGEAAGRQDRSAPQHNVVASAGRGAPDLPGVGTRVSTPARPADVGPASSGADPIAPVLPGITEPPKPTVEASRPLPSLPNPPTPALPPIPASLPPSVAAPPSPTPEALRRLAEDALRSVPCSTVSPDVGRDGQVTLRGIVGEGAAEAALRRGAEGWRAPSLDWHVATFDASYCDMLDAVRPYLRAAGPGPSTAPSLALRDGRTVLYNGERIEPEVTLAGFPAYVQVDYLTRDDKGAPIVLHMLTAAPAARGRPYQARSKLPLVPPQGNRSGWLVGLPFGADLIVTVASSRPLFPTEQPVDKVDPAGSYVAQLRAAMAAAAQKGGTVAADVFLLRTSERP